MGNNYNTCLAFFATRAKVSGNLCRPQTICCVLSSARLASCWALCSQNPNRFAACRIPSFITISKRTQKMASRIRSTVPISIVSSNTRMTTCLASIAVMGPEAGSEYFNISGGSIQSTNSSGFLNIGGGDSTSYKTLTFGTTAGTSGVWGLEGDTIITTQGSSYGRREYDLEWSCWIIFLGRTKSHY